MSYLVLARKWRPQTFEDVVGQDVIVKTLRQALESDRLAHSFLFCGSRGTGKTTLARILAKAMCCELGITKNPCGKCAICLSIADGSSLDVIEIDGASNTGVDDVRELKETIRYQPSQARFKVFIIDEVHMLSTNAFNALLKTLEEPPAHVKFILATTESHKIPITILSRCQKYDFKRLRVQAICEQLKKILGNEGVDLEEEAIRLIAQVAEGGMRDALSLLDQVLSFAPTNPTLKDVSLILGVTSRKNVLAFAMALLEQNSKEVFRIIDEVNLSGADLKKFADDVATEIRHLALSKATKSISGLVDLSEDEVAQIDSLAIRFEPQDLQRVFALMLEGIEQMSRSSQTRMTLELFCLKIADRPSFHSLATINQAISRLESLKKSSGQEEPRPSEHKPVFKPKALPKAEDFVLRWKDFVKAISRVNQSIALFLEHGRPQKDGTVSFEHRLYLERVLEVNQERWFKDIVEQFYGDSVQISWISLEKPDQKSAISIREEQELEQKKMQARIEENARSHPAVKKALALFGGEIKAVKKSDDYPLPANRISSIEN